MKTIVALPIQPSDVIRAAVGTHVGPRTVRVPVRPGGLPIRNAVLERGIAGIDTGGPGIEEIFIVLIAIVDRKRNSPSPLGLQRYIDLSRNTHHQEAA